MLFGVLFINDIILNQGLLLIFNLKIIMKFYSIIITIFFLGAGYLAYNFYTKMSSLNTELVSITNQLKQAKAESLNFKNLTETNLKDVKLTSSLLSSSLDSFLVAGDVKVASLSKTTSEEISQKIQEISDVQDKVALEDSWNTFNKTKKISDYFAFSRFIIKSLQNDIENIH